MTSSPVTPARPEGLGTFAGVFTPSILTILGVIMYLRFGWVVGNVGLLGALAIVTLATSITFLTALSISAIATDQKVRTGGAYYMISRSLGIETGGAVGIPLYFALALSVALYTIGFAESLSTTFPQLSERSAALVTTVGVAVLALISAKVALRSQYIVMTAIAISLVSLLFGKPIEATEIELTGAAPRLSEGFWVVFAVFFPAVTGIMAGVNMSGDLENPGRAIPRGTLAAVGVGYVVYMALPIILASRADAVTLIENPLIMRQIAWWGDAILLGVWGATLSSAVGSILTAPRVLQALARDRVLPRPLRFLGRGSGPADEPRLGIVVTLGVALVAVALGDLDLIAPVLTMFFLTTYCVLNIAAGTERLLDSPSFRPQFRVHWVWSLLGAVGCIAVMFLINWIATIVALIVVAAIYIWLEQRGLRAVWGDVGQGVWMAVTRLGLMKLDEATDPKTWRPHLLILTGAPTRRWHLIEFADAVGHQRSIMTVATVLTRTPADTVGSDRAASLRRTIEDYLDDRAVEALVRVVEAPDAFEGAEHLVEAYGLGSLAPNTVLLGDSEEPTTRERYVHMLAHFYRNRRNAVIVRHRSEHGFGERRRIDVWWGGLRGNGGLMITLADLLRTSMMWHGTTVNLKMVVADDAAAESARTNLGAVVEGLRIPLELDVIVAQGRPFEAILQAESRAADLVFLGMKAPGRGATFDAAEYAAYYDGLRARTAGLPTVVFVLAAEDLPFKEILA